MIGKALLWAASAVLAAKLGLEVQRMVLAAWRPAAAALSGCVTQDGHRCYKPGR